MHNWNQLQPAPYDGMYQFPSVNSMNPTTGKPQAVNVAVSSLSESGNLVTVTTASPHGLSSSALVTIAGAPNGYNGTSLPITVTGARTFTYTSTSAGLAAGASGTVSAGSTNCSVCIADPDASDPYRHGTSMLPAGKYVVEMVVPPGYELVKEEDKNILIGDNYIAPVTQEFPGLGSAIYILPDQAEVSAAYNANNAQNPTVALGRTTLPSHEGDTGSVETFWPCVGHGARGAGLHQPVPAVARSGAVRRRDPQPVRPQGSHARRPDLGAGEVLGLHLGARRRALHRRDHR